jgi:hypothetical protein
MKFCIGDLTLQTVEKVKVWLKLTGILLEIVAVNLWYSVAEFHLG